MRPEAWVRRAAGAIPILALVLTATTRGEVAVESGLSWGFNSNVYEAVEHDRWVGDGFARVEAGARRHPEGAPGWGWLGHARLAAEQYSSERSEDRFLMLGALGALWRGERAQGTWSWTGQASTRPHADSLAVGRHQFAHTGGARVNAATRLGWRADGTWVNTEEGGPSGRRSWRVGGDLERALGRQWLGAVLCEGGEALYDEPAIGAWRDGVNVRSGEEHRDRQLMLGARIDRVAATLVQVSYGLRTIDSNSLGYSQNRHELSFSLARLLPYRVSLQFLGQWQEPEYRDEGFEKWRLRDDPEDLDLGARSSLTVSLRRPLAGAFGAEIQGGWERNESRVSGTFYERVNLLLALRYQASP